MSLTGNLENANLKKEMLKKIPTIKPATFAVFLSRYFSLSACLYQERQVYYPCHLQLGVRCVCARPLCCVFDGLTSSWSSIHFEHVRPHFPFPLTAFWFTQQLSSPWGPLPRLAGGARRRGSPCNRPDPGRTDDFTSERKTVCKPMKRYFCPAQIC